MIEDVKKQVIRSLRSMFSRQGDCSGLYTTLLHGVFSLYLTSPEGEEPSLRGALPFYTPGTWYKAAGGDSLLEVVAKYIRSRQGILTQDALPSRGHCT